MSKTILGVVAVVVLIAGGAYWWMQHNNTAVDSAASTNSAPLTASDIKWSFEDAGTHFEGGAPHTIVSLSVRGEAAKEAGTFYGSCSPLSTEVLQKDEISGVLCWFAGGGDEVGIFKEDGKFVVKAGVQNEGSPEEIGFRGNFTTLFEVK